MQVGTAHSIGNPNESWLDSKGTWLTYVILIAIGHLVILSVPFLDTATAWTMTNTMHNVVSSPSLRGIFMPFKSLLSRLCFLEKLDSDRVLTERSIVKFRSEM